MDQQNRRVRRLLLWLPAVAIVVAMSGVPVLQPVLRSRSSELTVVATARQKSSPVSLASLAAAVPAPEAPDGDACAAASWVTAWSAPPQDSSADQAPNPGAADNGDRPQVFEDQTLRLVVTPTIAGTRTRLHLSNRFGRAPVTFGAVTVGRFAGGGAVTAARPATFGGAGSVTIASGTSVVSDEVELSVEPFADLAVSLHVVDATPLDVHLFAQQTQFASPPGTGDHTADAGGAAFTEHLSSWLALAAVDVLASGGTGTVVALGDSITDGLGATVDASQRWTDHLARRLLSEAGAPALAVANGGIAGNQLTRDNVIAVDGAGGGMGPSATTRFGPDVIDRAGVTDVIVFIGINDLYAPTGPDPVAAIIDGYRGLVDRARFAGLGIIGTTMTPGGLSPEKELQRQAVNEWVRTGGAFDTVVDLDAVVRDPADSSAVSPAFAVDPVHLNDAGYAAVADAFNLGVFRGTGC